MFLDLEAFLDKNVDPIRKGMIMGAMYELYNHGHIAAYSEISRLLSTANMDTISGILDGVETITETGLNLVLRAFDIQSDGTIAIKTDILEGIRILETYEDSDTIVALCEDSVDAVETLSNLLALVTDKTWADYIDVLQSVSHKLIETLADKHRTETEVDDEILIPFDDKRKEAIVKFISLFPVTIAKTAILEDEVQLGIPFDVLKTKHTETLHTFEPKAPEALAGELVGLALISDLPFNNLSKEIKDQLEFMFADVEFITKVSISMDKVFDEVLKNG